MNPKIELFHGPNKFADSAGAVVEFEPPFNETLSADSIDKQWKKLDSHQGRSLWTGNQPENELSFVDLYTEIVSYFRQPVAVCDHKCISGYQIGNNQRAWIFLCHTHSNTANLILRSSMALTNEIFSLIVTGHPCINKLVPNPIANLQRQVANLHYSKTANILLTVALSRGIPTYPISLGGNIWQYGQGSLGRHYRSAADEFDSLTGDILCRNKVYSNELINRLGFPGVVHEVARNPDHAAKIAALIGYPVVTKPISAGMGKGITTSIDNPDELVAAFKLAASISPRGVIIEKYVKGTDHRLAVFGGELLWVMARYPARVIGDGVHSIATLIGQENLRRKGDIDKKAIMQDAAMDELLAKMGLSYDSVPAPGKAINLRSVANVSMGGTMEDVMPRIHPDNRYMALAIARAFRMNAIGIDFITEDISKSWRESSCAVIEVNQTPGVLCYIRAEKQLNRMFPSGNDGRIPTILLIEAPPRIRQAGCYIITGCQSVCWPGNRITNFSRQAPQGEIV